MRKAFLIAAAGIVSGTLFYFGTGLHPICWLLWLAPIPVLVIARQLRAGTAFLFAAIIWLIGEMNLWNYLTHGIELPLPLVIIFLLIPAVAFGLAILFTRSFHAARINLARGACFSLLLGGLRISDRDQLASQHIRKSWLHANGRFADYSDHCHHWHLGDQLHCISVCRGSPSCLIGAGKPKRRQCAGCFCRDRDWCSGVLYGIWRLHSNSTGQSSMVTLIAKDVPMSVYLGPEQQALELLQGYADEVRRATPAGTEVVVLPEKIGRLSEASLPQVDALFSSAAAATHSAIVLGMVRRTSPASFNSARFYSAAGKLEANYDKHHLLPGVEPEKPGDKRVVLDQPSGRWGLQICKDMDFPQTEPRICRLKARACSSSQRGISILIAGCTRAWLSCAGSRTVLRSLVQRATGS